MLYFRILLSGLLLSFASTRADTIELHDTSLEFSNCSFDIELMCESSELGSCVVSSFTASSSTASCTTPKKIVGQLSTAMPSCTKFQVQVGNIGSSCQGTEFCSGFCGTNQCLQDLSDGTSKDLVTCMICPFTDTDIDITFVFSATVCAAAQVFQRTLTLTILDQSVLECCDVCPCP